MPAALQTCDAWRKPDDEARNNPLAFWADPTLLMDWISDTDKTVSVARQLAPVPHRVEAAGASGETAASHPSPEALAWHLAAIAMKTLWQAVLIWGRAKRSRIRSAVSRWRERAMRPISIPAWWLAGYLGCSIVSFSSLLITISIAMH